MAPKSNNNLLALGSAAVLAVYGTGFLETKPAADRMAAESAESARRRPPRPSGDASSARDVVGEEAGATTVSGDVVPPTSIASGEGTASPVATASAAKTLTASTPNADHTTDKAVSTAAPHIASTDTSATHSASVPASNASSTTSLATAQTVAVESPVTAPPPVAAPVVSTPPTATETATPTPAQTAAPKAKTPLKDGFFVGRGRSRHGDVEAMIEIKDARIISAVISQCLTRYSCSWIEPLLPQVVSRQSADVDVVSGATESSNALYYAVLQALAQAK